MVLLLLFVLVPVAELAVIGQVGAALGFWWTLGLLVGDSIAGAFLVRHEGRRAWRSFWTALQEARWPGDEVANGMLVLVGGALLLTPGFLTDATGLLLVLAPTRRVVAAVVRRRFVTGGLTMVAGPFGPIVGGVAGRAADHLRRPPDGAIVDVEVVSIERDDAPMPDPPPAAIE